MFRLIKIQNSGVNVPEPQIQKKSAKKIVAGELLVLSGGALASPATGTLPTHVALSGASEGDTECVCAEISPDMVFECPVLAGTPASLTVGTKVCPVAENGSLIGINTTTASGTATVYDTLFAAALGDKVLVKFR